MRKIIDYALADFTNTHYRQMISILLSLPTSLSTHSKFNNKEKNAVRRANLLRRKLHKKYAKNIHKWPNKRP